MLGSMAVGSPPLADGVDLWPPRFENGADARLSLFGHQLKADSIQMIQTLFLTPEPG